MAQADQGVASHLHQMAVGLAVRRTAGTDPANDIAVSGWSQYWSQSAPERFARGLPERAKLLSSEYDSEVLVDPGLQNTNPAAALRAAPIGLAEPGCRTGQRRKTGRHGVAEP
jgi:hypothetical protein